MNLVSKLFFAQSDSCIFLNFYFYFMKTANIPVYGNIALYGHIALSVYKDTYKCTLTIPLKWKTLHFAHHQKTNTNT